MFSRLSSYSDFNKSVNREFVKGIPSLRDSVLTDKTMDIKKPLFGNINPYSEKLYCGVDSKFSVDPAKFAEVIAIEEDIRHYRVNEPIYRASDISFNDFRVVQKAKRKNLGV